MNFCGQCGRRLPKLGSSCPTCHPVQKETTNSSTVLSVILTCLLSAALFCTMFAAVGVLEIRRIAKEETIETYMETVELDRMLCKLESFSGESVFLQKQELYSYVYNECGGKLDDDTMQMIFERSTISDFFGTKIEYFVKKAAQGKLIALTISRDEIEILLDENKEIIEKRADMYLTRSDISVLSYWMTGGCEEIVIIDLREIKQQEPVWYYIVWFSTSYVTMWICLALSAFTILLMFMNQAKEAVSALTIVGVLLGAAWMLVSLLIGWDITILGVVGGILILCSVGTLLIYQRVEDTRPSKGAR